MALDILFAPRTVGALRAATGVLFLSRGQAMARTWIDSNRSESAVLARSVGARDFAIGAGLLATGHPSWLAASVFSDIVDGGEALVGHVPDDRKKAVAAWALGFAAYGLIAAVTTQRAEST